MEKERTSLYLDKKQMEALRALTAFTRVKMADYVREGVDLVLDKYQKELRKAQKKGGAKV